MLNLYKDRPHLAINPGSFSPRIKLGYMAECLGVWLCLTCLILMWNLTQTINRFLFCWQVVISDW